MRDALIWNPTRLPARSSLLTCRFRLFSNRPEPLMSLDTAEAKYAEHSELIEAVQGHTVMRP